MRTTFAALALALPVNAFAQTPAEVPPPAVQPARALPMPPPPPPPPRPGRAMQIEGSITHDDYPAEALLKGEQGQVSLEFQVGVDGRPKTCRAQGVQGALPILEAASCRIVLERFRYRPAVDERGRKIVETKSQRINWVMPVEDPQMTEGAFTATFDVSEAGIVSNCSASGDLTGPFDAANFCKTYRGGPMLDRESKPGPHRVTIKVSIDLEPIAGNKP